MAGCTLVMRGREPIPFHRAHGDELLIPDHERFQLLRGFGREEAMLWAHGFPKPGQSSGIQCVGFGQLPDRFGNTVLFF